MSDQENALGSPQSNNQLDEKIDEILNEIMGWGIKYAFDDYPGELTAAAIKRDYDAHTQITNLIIEELDRVQMRLMSVSENALNLYIDDRIKELKGQL